MNEKNEQVAPLELGVNHHHVKLKTVCLSEAITVNLLNRSAPLVKDIRPLRFRSKE